MIGAAFAVTTGAHASSGVTHYQLFKTAENDTKVAKNLLASTNN
jgi:hypothetical protein